MKKILNRKIIGILVLIFCNSSFALQHNIPIVPNSISTAELRMNDKNSSELQIINPIAICGVTKLDLFTAVMLDSQIRDTYNFMLSAGYTKNIIAKKAESSLKLHLGIALENTLSQLGYTRLFQNLNFAASVKRHCFGVGIKSKYYKYNVYNAPALDAGKKNSVFEEEHFNLDLNLGFHTEFENLKFSVVFQNVDSVFKKSESVFTKQDFISELKLSIGYNFTDRVMLMTGADYLINNRDEKFKQLNFSFSPIFHVNEKISFSGFIKSHDTFNYFSFGLGISVLPKGNVRTQYAIKANNSFGIQSLPQAIGVGYSFQ